MKAQTDRRKGATGSSESFPETIPSLSIYELGKRFDGASVVQDLTLNVMPGELVSILGPSGCGKTTTLRMIAGFERPDSGSIRIGGKDVSGGTIDVPPDRRRVGMVFQEYALFPHMSVAQNVGFGLPRGRDRVGRVAEMLALVGLDGAGGRFPAELSGGQQQRVAVARALAPRPAIVLLDEPFSNLDQSLRVQLREEIRRILRAANATAVLVTHDQEEALSISDRVGVILNGRLRQVGSPEEIHHRPIDRDVAGFVGDATFLPGIADGSTVTTVLGALTLHRDATGPVDVLIRPEMVALCEAGDVRANGIVAGCQFHGRDQTVLVALPDGTIIPVRVSSYQRIAVGDEVSLTVRSEVVSFPRDAAPAD